MCTRLAVLNGLAGIISIFQNFIHSPDEMVNINVRIFCPFFKSFAVGVIYLIFIHYLLLFLYPKNNKNSARGIEIFCIIQVI